MEHRFTDDSLSLHTDLYQINMAETYWRDGIDQKKPSLNCFSESSLLTAVLRYLPVWRKRLNICKVSDLLKAI